MELYRLSLAPPQRELESRIVLVTGAAGGIGLGIARRLAAEGAHVVLTDLDEKRCHLAAEAICKDHGMGRAVGIQMNVADEQSVREGFDAAVLTFGGLDILVSNAGVADSARIEDLDLEIWERSFAVNATGHFLAARQAVRIFREQGIGGNILFNVSKNTFAPGAEFGAYSSAKAAELQLAKVLAIENGGQGVRVNMLNPDAVFAAGLWSPALKARRAQAQGIAVEDLEDFYRQRNLLKVSVTAEDVAEAALWLVSDRSSKTTGCVIPVDGGIREAFPR
jgi:NAD(P)-dependent dehydrogenase (short-subunit alcohol dehydrogenase family)